MKKKMTAILMAGAMLAACTQTVFAQDAVYAKTPTQPVFCQIPQNTNAYPVRLEPSYISASSVHYTEGVDSYEAQRVNDWDVTTGWVEGVDGSGIGEHLDFSFPAGTVITSVHVVPGFCKREDLFYRNNAPALLELSSNGMTVKLDTRCGSDNYYSAVGGWDYTLSPYLVCDGNLRVTIKGVRMGSEWDDTVISELSFMGYTL